MSQTTGTLWARPADRWPTALALVSIAGALAVIVLSDREAEIFVPVVATMAGIYLTAYATGRRRTAWSALFGFSAMMAVLHALHWQGAEWAAPAIWMTVAAGLAWLWTVVRRRYTDGKRFALQTVGLAGFGGITLVCAAVQPRLALVLAGVGFLAHAGWDAYHFKTRQVVSRPYAEFCGVFDVAVGVALIVSAVAA